MSVRSQVSGHSKRSRVSSAKPKELSRRGRTDDSWSIISSQDAKTEVYSELAEDDEWAAIQKFNTLLHYEEQKQTIIREHERRRLIREELDRQMREK